MRRKRSLAEVIVARRDQAEQADWLAGEFQRQRDEARAERDRFREALEFYADPTGYTSEGVKTDGAAFGWDHPDRGAAARAALAGSVSDKDRGPER